MASNPPGKRPAPAPSNPVLRAAQAQWLFSNEELARTPSQLDGMKPEQETIQRSKGVTFITQVGIMLKLPQPTLATAAVYFHRFFMRFSMVDKPDRPGMHPYPIAGTSLFLATKVEENVRRMKEIVVACCRVAQKQPNLVVDEQSKDFWRWRDTILHNEDVLLEALCFDLQLEQPYRILYDYICFLGANENKQLRNSSWAFLNDSMFTALCLQFSARVIAAAALYAAARHSDIAFEDDQEGRPWWDQIDVDLTQVRRACTRMTELYESNAAHKHSPYYPTTPLIWDEGTEKTRIPRSGTTLDVPDPASRKRSREPEDDPTRQQNPRSTAILKVDEVTQSGQRSPKRPRVGSDAEKPRSAAASFASSSTIPHAGDGVPSHPNATSPPSSNDRNGHTNRYQHPLPPTPRSSFPPRRSSEPKSVDPIQQRIDQIVQQNASTPPKAKRIPERGYRDRDDDDPNWNRKLSYSSYSSSTGRNDHPPPPRDREREWDRDRERDRDRDRDRDRGRERERERERGQPPPPPLPEPAPDEEGGGSEEGEL
ncbi:cyclin-like protein [Aspergillus karnatakaensis]|uniref:putative cyclin n=1 Tax=Aspergillus karnatakaensis TaxID=1810916 RepID=UPI003CCD927E